MMLPLLAVNSGAAGSEQSECSGYTHLPELISNWYPCHGQLISPSRVSIERSGPIRCGHMVEMAISRSSTSAT